MLFFFLSRIESDCIPDIPLILSYYQVDCLAFFSFPVCIIYVMFYMKHPEDDCYDLTKNYWRSVPLVISSVDLLLVCIFISRSKA